MNNKPITVARNDYLNNIIEITNNSGLPAFAISDILEKILSQVNKAAEQELKRDSIEWRKACSEEAQNGEVTNDGGQEDK